MEENTRCTICLSEPIINKCYNNICRHISCLPCLQSWVFDTPFCPLCRKDISKIFYWEDGLLTELNVTKRAQEARLRLYSHSYSVYEFPETLPLYTLRPNYYRSVRNFLTRDILIVLGLAGTPAELVFDLSRLLLNLVVHYIADNPEIHVLTLKKLMVPFMQMYALKFTLELGAFFGRIRHRAEREP